jgi:hypothetical protein
MLLLYNVDVVFVDCLQTRNIIFRIVLRSLSIANTFI